MIVRIVFRCVLIASCFSSALFAPAQVYQDEITDAFLASRTIDVSKKVGVVAGTPGVSPTGGATYSIPIYVPLGTNGMQPSISVNYNSQGGDGVMGWCWSVSAVSAIVRTGMDWYHDSQSRGVTYGTTDRFMVDGQRLVLIEGTTYGAPDTKYDTENATFATYTANGSTNGAGPQSFTVITKDGMTRYYGGTTDSRVVADNGAVVIWMLNRVQDAFGNFMDYTYSQDLSECRLAEITYTGNTAANITPYNKVVFHYTGRPDVNEVYFPGEAMKTSHLLQRIEIVCESETRKEYRFNYSLRDIEKSYLREVQEFSGAGEQAVGLNSTVIKYANPATSINFRETTSVLEGNGHDFYSGDFNGDGDSELLTSTYHLDESGNEVNDNLEVWERRGASDFARLWHMDLPSSVSHSLLNIQRISDTYGSTLSTDMNGDGRDDIILLRTMQINTHRFIINVLVLEATMDATGDLDFIEHVYNAPSVNDECWCEIASNAVNYHSLGDFDGDGKGDLLLYASNDDGETIAFLYSPFAEAFGTPVDFPGGFETILPAHTLTSINFDGDQATEIMAVPSQNSPNDVTKVYKWTSTPNWGFHIMYSYDFPEPQDDYRFGDMNGDGKTDLLHRDGPGSSWYISYGVGNGFNTRSFPLLSSNANLATNTLLVADLNGDGRSDVFRAWQPAGGGVSTNMDIFYSRGSHSDFELLSQTLGNPWGLSPALITDLNGDGRSEVINTTDIHSPIEIFFFGPKGRERSVEKIVNGMGATSLFTMAYLNEGAHLPGYDRLYPNISGQPPLLLTQALTVPDGINGENTTTYAYGDAQLHMAGRGFVGFKHFVTQNAVANHRILNDYELQEDYAELIPASSTIFRANEPTEMLTSTMSTYDHVPLGTEFLRRHLTRPLTTITFDALAGTTSKAVNTAFDAYGNITGHSAHVNGIVVTHTATTYAAAGPPPIPAKPEDITVTTTRTGSPAVVKRTHQVYRPVDGALASVTEYLNGSEGVSKDLTYNAAGAVETTTERYPGLATAQRRRETFQYDSRFRFPEIHRRIWNNDGTEVPVRTITHFDPFWGKPKDQLSSDGLTTFYYYDEFGRLEKTQVPDVAGQERYALTCTLSWDIDGLRRYYRTTKTDPRGADMITQHDLLGRTITEMREAFSANPGAPIYSTVDFAYDHRGNVYTETTPHLPTETFLTITHEFDDYNRPEMDMHPTADATEYAYDYADGQLTTSVHNASGVWKESTTDATGKVVSASDEGGKLTYSYDSWGNLTTITLNEYLVTKNSYDGFGQQTATALMNGGTTFYQYDRFGQLVYQKDANANEVTMVYDNLGRMTLRTGPEGQTKYVYFYSSGRVNDNLVLADGPGGIHSYAYNDPFHRLTSETRIISGQLYTHSYGYDIYDRVTSHSYPSGFTVDQAYANDGSLQYVMRGHDILFWGMEQNGQGRYTKYQLGDGRIVNKKYEPEGWLQQIKADGVQDLDMGYDPLTGNMEYRWDNIQGLKETFGYDELSRLTSSLVEPVDGNGNATGTPISQEEYHYDGNMGSTFGDLKVRSSVGSFGYNGMAVTAARSTGYPTPPDAPPMDISLETQTISYTPFLKTKSITETVQSNIYELTYTYGPEHHRVRSLLNESGHLIQERIYAGAYEKLMTDDEWFENHYIQGGDGLCAIVVKYNGTWLSNAVYTDHLGSIVAVTDMSTSNVVAEQNFDPWGRHRKPSTWTLFEGTPDLPLWLYRGFTGHEHVEPFALINMNGRMYDPANGRMLGVDNYVQGGLGTQGYNRYSYAGNNPLKYTDPSGDFLWVPVIVGAAIFGYLGGASANGGEWNPGKWDYASGQTWAGIGIGAVAGGFAGYGAIQAGMALSGTGLFAAFSNGSVAAFGLSMGAGGAAAGYVTGLGTGFINSNGNLSTAHQIGKLYAGIGGAIGTVAGLIYGGTEQGKSYMGHVTEQLIVSTEGGGVAYTHPKGINWGQARWHYLYGKGTPLSTPLSTVDLSKIHASDFPFGSARHETFNLFGKFHSTHNDALVYGKLALSLTRDHKWLFSTTGFDEYNFELHPWKGNFKRNINTIFGGFINGPGMPFDIYLPGIVPVAP